MQQLQAKMQEVEGRMADPAVYADKQQFLQAEKDYSTVKQQLDTAQLQYEKAFESLMELEEQLKS